MIKGKILYVNQEVMPYVPETQMSYFGRYLPQIMQDQFQKEVRVFMPNFGTINERKNQLHEVIRLSGLNIVVDSTDHPLLIKVASIPAARMQVYFIDNEDYFKRKYSLRDGSGKLFEDNSSRCVFFSHGVLETIKKLAWKPSIINCAGWFSALVPFYTKRTIYKHNPYYSDSKIILSLFNDDFEGKLDETLVRKLKKDGGSQKDWEVYSEPTYLNLMKAAIYYSDGIIVASEDVNSELIDYAKQLKKPMVDYAPMPDIAEPINNLYESIMILDD
ncbi:MAG: glycogen/starch synthase [Bacteroidales bacterium]|jgi:starch synthase|nr:glycogen/starch synthase [Bacteroidales bacterium]